MDNKLNGILDLSNAEMFREAANILESLALHSLEIASNFSGNPDASCSWFIQGPDELKLAASRVKSIAGKMRDFWWELAYKQAAKGAVRIGLDFDSFIAEYLTPKGKISEESKDRFFRDYILREAVIDDEDNERIAEYIKKMTYSDFLKTPYWSIISEARKRNSNGCACCGSTEKLEVHHPVYDWHGYEHEHFNELTVLCHNCHTKIHKK